MTDNVNFEHDVNIDETILDVEWLEQPNLMLKYGKLVVDARKEYDLAKERLDVVKAELDKEIRMNPDEFGLTKATESAIFSVILTHPKYRKVSDRLIEAKYNLGMVQTVANSIDVRKAALENLVRLHGQQYFAGPKVPHDLSYERQKVYSDKKTNDKIKIKRRRV